MNTIELKAQGTSVTITLSEDMQKRLVEILDTTENLGLKGEQNGVTFDIQFTKEVVERLINNK